MCIRDSAKIAYKYLNYATGTVLRSTKLVFVMAISVVWLGRKYSAWDYAAALFMISSVVGSRRALSTQYLLSVWLTIS